jgi:hypothetical protein
MCVLIFSTAFDSVSSQSKKKWARCDWKCISGFMWSSGYSCPILLKLEFYRKIFEKYSNANFHENPSCESTERRTDGQAWRNSFCNFKKAPKKWFFCLSCSLHHVCLYFFSSLCITPIGHRNIHSLGDKSCTNQNKLKVTVVHLKSYEGI